MINDYFKPQQIDGQKLKKLKGHVKLTLKDAKTGEIQKVVEGDNIFTNALPDIITQCNYFGCMDYSQILPLWEKWFGGCLLYQDPFPVDEQTGEPDPNDYFIKNDSVNKVIAHAGDTYTSDIRDDPKRGMPNTYLQQRTPNSITMGFQWSPTCGNGQISAISLCHKDVGNCGTGSNSNAFKTLKPFIIASKSNMGVWPNYTFPSTVTTRKTPMGFLDGHWCVRAWIGEADEEDINVSHHNYEATTFCFYRAGLKDVGVTDSNIRSEDLHTGTAYRVNWNWATTYKVYWFDDENKVLWLFANYPDGRNHVNHFWGMKTNFVKNSSGQWIVGTSDYFDVYPNEDIIGELRYKGQIKHQYKILENGTKQDVFYFPYYDASRSRTDSRKFVKFNFQNQADYSIVKVVSNATASNMVTSLGGDTTDEIIPTFGWVMNDGIGYQCSKVLDEYWPANLSHDGVATVGFGAYSDDRNIILVDKMILVTKFNLNDSVMKTASNTMELEYTITEVD